MMKKQVFTTLILSVIFFSSNDCFAMSPGEIRARGNVCSDGKTVELAYAKADGTLETKACYGNYETAKSDYDKETNAESDNLVIIENGMIIDAKYALIDYDQTTDTKYTNVYSDKNLKTRTNYIKVTPSSSDDAVLLEVDYATKRIKIKVNEMIGWIKKYEYEDSQKNILYDIIPVIWVKSPSTYKVTEKDITHCLPGNMMGEKATQEHTIGPKPEMLNPGTYYSYDGHYFYQDLKVMIKDYKNNTYTSSINKDKPYYNYYQYLSFRTKTNYNASNINQYLKERTSSTSKLIGSGESFIKYQNSYGINASLMLSIAINESDWGRSSIAMSKNNLFGLNAVDANPNLAANEFSSVDHCINDYAYAWLSYGYVQPGDARFRGANLGTKGEGLNIKYASDTYWGEIAASLYYQLDKTYGLQDYNAYQLAVLKADYSNKVYATKTPGGERVSTAYYQYQVKSSPVIILEEVTGPSVEGNTTWYKIMSDPTLDVNKNYIGDSKSNPRINYIEEYNQVYVPAAYFIKTNTKINDNTTEEDTKPTPSPTPSQTPTPTPKPDVPIKTIIETAGLKESEGYLSGISVGMNVEELKKKLTNNNAIIKIEESSGGEAKEMVKTAQKVTITSGKLEERFLLIVPGDTNGDGNISAVDYVKIKNHIMGSDKLASANLKAADVNKDGGVSAVDYVKVKNYIMGDKNAI